MYSKPKLIDKDSSIKLKAWRGQEETSNRANKLETTKRYWPKTRERISIDRKRKEGSKRGSKMSQKVSAKI